MKHRQLNGHDELKGAPVEKDTAAWSAAFHWVTENRT